MSLLKRYLKNPNQADQGVMFPEVGVIALVPDFWNSPWMVRHHVLTRLAKYFHVVWVDRPRDWRECLAGKGKPSRNEPSNNGFSIYRHSMFLPTIYRPAFIGKAICRKRLQIARSHLVSKGCKRIILYLWRPQFLEATEYIDHDMCCYHIDDEYTFNSNGSPIEQREVSILERADSVFIHSPALWEKKARFNPNTHLIPMGADYSGFSKPRAEPSEMRDIPHPRIGYVGYLKGQLDLPLINVLAGKHPKWSFVFVGPNNSNLKTYAKEIDELLSKPNVYSLGNKPVNLLPSYVQHMDALTLPYQQNDYTKFISPMKLNEYLATGVPVVGSPIPYLREFPAVVMLATGYAEWSENLEKALQSDARSKEQREKRQEIARRYDWSKIVHTIAQRICEDIDEPYLNKIKEMSESPSHEGSITKSIEFQECFQSSCKKPSKVDCSISSEVA